MWKSWKIEDDNGEDWVKTDNSLNPKTVKKHEQTPLIGVTESSVVR